MHDKQFEFAIAQCKCQIIQIRISRIKQEGGQHLHKQYPDGKETLRRACGNISSARDMAFLALSKGHRTLMPLLQYLLLSTQWNRLWRSWNVSLKIKRHGHPTYFHAVTLLRAGFKHGMLLSHGSSYFAINMGSRLAPILVAATPASEAKL